MHHLCSHRTRLVLLAAYCVPLGLLTKWVGDGWVNDHLGGAFYVVFWSAAAMVVVPRAKPATVILGVLAATCGIEFLPLSHPPFLERIRKTAGGALILGTTFNGIDFPFYALGALGAWWPLARLSRARNTPYARPASTADNSKIHAIHTEAFGRAAEADLVDRLRAAGAARISLVAGINGVVVGHVLFSPTTISNVPEGVTTLGLAPLAVLPDHQRKGVGSEPVNAGLDACRDAQCDAVFVLGEPEYYGRFGFRPASELGMSYASLGPNPAFMVCELRPGALEGARGTVEYHEEFSAVTGGRTSV